MAKSVCNNPTACLLFFFVPLSPNPGLEGSLTRALDGLGGCGLCAFMLVALGAAFCLLHRIQTKLLVTAGMD
jgi:hypothetical protein